MPRRSSSGQQVNHFPNRDYDVTLDHANILKALKKTDGLQNDVIVTIMTPAGGPRHQDPFSSTIAPTCYDMNVALADQDHLEMFTQDWFYGFAPMTNEVLGTSLQQTIDSTMDGFGSIQISQVTPGMWERHMAGGTMKHKKKEHPIDPYTQKVEMLDLMGPHELMDGVGVKMCLDFYASEKGLHKNKRATRLLMACGIENRDVYGPAILVKYKENSKNEGFTLQPCRKKHVPDADSATGSDREWDGMWICVAKMVRNGVDSLSKSELQTVKDIEMAMECKKKGNELFAEEKYRQAIEEYSKGLKVIPDCSPLLLNRSLMYMRLKEYELAYPDLAGMMQRDPGNEKVVYRTAQCMKEQGNPKSAIEFMALWLKDNRSIAVTSLLRDTYKGIMQPPK